MRFDNHVVAADHSGHNPTVIAAEGEYIFVDPTRPIAYVLPDDTHAVIDGQTYTVQETAPIAFGNPGEVTITQEFTEEDFARIRDLLERYTTPVYTQNPWSATPNVTFTYNPDGMQRRFSGEFSFRVNDDGTVRTDPENETDDPDTSELDAYLAELQALVDKTPEQTK